MGVTGSIYDQGKTTIYINLVPLGEKFDNMTALSIYDKFWQKNVKLSKSKFHGYEVISVNYPGLPSSLPPSAGSSASAPSGTGQRHPFPADVSTGKTQKMKARIIAVVSLSSCILIIACILIVIAVLKTKNSKCPPATSEAVIIPSVTRRSGFKSIVPNSAASSASASFPNSMATYSNSVRTFSLDELEKATDGFNTRRILGEGGFGRVYYGILQEGSEVAIKVLTKENQNRYEREFITEVEMLSRLHHRNLVKLIGICSEGQKRCLIYELVRNGSVESHLHGVDKQNGPLDWDARLKIALGTARALAYLHEDSNPGVIHRDFKASNVLLEPDFTPKVSDFGLAKESSEGSHHVSTRIMGTFGYVDPEYAMTGQLLAKSDVYSYGVLLLELLSGRKAVYVSDLQDPESLVSWARPLLASKEGLEQLIDPSLQANCDFDNIARVAAIALMCVNAELSKRPFMGEVVQALKLICNGKDEIPEVSYSQKKSSSYSQESEFRGDFGPESCWWSRASSPVAYGHASSFFNMDNSLDLVDEMQRPHSVPGLVGRAETVAGYNRSGPLRTKRQRQAFYRLKGSVSEHASPSFLFYP